MNTVTTTGIDLAKNSFPVYGVNAKGKPVLNLIRAGVVRFFTNLPPELLPKIRKGVLACPLGGNTPCHVHKKKALRYFQGQGGLGRVDQR